MSHTHEKAPLITLSTPVAIIIAGALIAIGVYFGLRDGAKGVSVVKTAVAAPQNIQNAPVTTADHIRGSISAKTIIVEYSDTECPFCKSFHQTLKQTMQTFDQNEVAWVYRHFPIDGLHSKARKEAEATECAFEQGGNDAFWKYLDRLFEITPSNNRLDASELPKIAEYVGVDVKAFEICLKSGKYAAKVATQEAMAKAAGARGTPYSVIITSNKTTPLKGAVSFEALKAQLQ